jgi:hypothetical protein
MTDAKRRGLRTAMQLVVTLGGNGALFGLLAVLGADVTLEQYGAVTAVLLPVVTAALNGMEDSGTIPALLKAPASPGVNPVPDGDAATAEVGTENTGRAAGGLDEGPEPPGSRRL